MKKFSKIIIAALLGLFLIAGSSWAIPSEWGIINPEQLSGTPSSMNGFGYYIWTDDVERTSWHIRWINDDSDSMFNGNIVMENNTMIPTKYNFDSNAFYFMSGSSDSVAYSTHSIAGQLKGVDFTITQTDSLSYVGFDLFYDGADMDATYIFLGENKETVASLGEDQDFGIVAPVPEPGTMLLLGSGLLGMAVVSRKKIFKS